MDENLLEPDGAELIQLRAQVGQRLRAWRTALGLDQRQMAQRLGMRPVTVSAVEMGRRGLSMVFLARASEVGIPVEYLLTGKPWAGATAASRVLLAISEVVGKARMVTSDAQLLFQLCDDLHRVTRDLARYFTDADRTFFTLARQEYPALRDAWNAAGPPLAPSWDALIALTLEL